MTNELAGKVAIVTGAGRNIGRAIALALAEGGASVVVNARSNRPEADAVAREIEIAGGKALVHIGDVADAVQVTVEGRALAWPVHDTAMETVPGVGGLPTLRLTCRLEAAAKLGCTLPSPFQSLAFLALSVIPSLKITDYGLVDVDAFELVPLEV